MSEHTLEEREQALLRHTELTYLIESKPKSYEEIKERLDHLDREWCEERLNIVSEYGLKYDRSSDSWILKTEEEIKREKEMQKKVKGNMKNLGSNFFRNIKNCLYLI